MEKIDIAEVLNQIVKKACDFEKPKVKVSTSNAATTTTATTTTTTAYRKGKAEVTTKKTEVTAEEDVEVFKAEEMDQVLVQPVAVAYPNLVSNNTKWIHKND